MPHKDKLKNILSTAGMIIGLAGAIASPFIAVGVAKAELKTATDGVRDSKESIKALWQNVSADRIVLTKHEALIPVIQRDIADVKNGQDKINDKLDRLLQRR